MIKDYDEFRARLAGVADDGYREFCMKGIPSERPFIGVRIPQIREIVKEIVPEYIEKFLKVEPVAIEEVLARGMVICRLPYEEIVCPQGKQSDKSWFDSQVELIDDWCNCDVFCSGVVKVTKKRREEFLESKVEPLLKDQREYATRIGLVILKCGYVDFGHLAVIFDRVEMLAQRDEYYVKMAIAWLVAECFIKYPEETFAYLKATKLPKWTYNKTISKICDSYRVAPEVKDVLRKMRKR